MGSKEVDREEEEEEEEMRKIEEEITEMAERVSRYRSTLPRHLLISPLLSQTLSPSSLIPSAADVAPSSSSTEGVPLVEEDQETTERTKVLKQKISDNISAVPVLLKRVKNVISRFDKLDSCNIVVPPVYKKKRMN